MGGSSSASSAGRLWNLTLCSWSVPAGAAAHLADQILLPAACVGARGKPKWVNRAGGASAGGSGWAQ